MYDTVTARFAIITLTSLLSGCMSDSEPETAACEFRWVGDEHLLYSCTENEEALDGDNCVSDGTGYYHAGVTCEEIGYGHRCDPEEISDAGFNPYGRLGNYLSNRDCDPTRPSAQSGFDTSVPYPNNNSSNGTTTSCSPSEGHFTCTEDYEQLGICRSCPVGTTCGPPGSDQCVEQPQSYDTVTMTIVATNSTPCGPLGFELSRGSTTSGPGPVFFEGQFQGTEYVSPQVDCETIAPGDHVVTTTIQFERDASTICIAPTDTSGCADDFFAPLPNCSVLPDAYYEPTFCLHKRL